MNNTEPYLITFSDMIDLFGEFVSDLLPQVCGCPAFIFIGAICAAIGVVKMAFTLMDL